MNTLPHSLDRSLVIRAPRAIVFRYFADAERFARWWGVGSTIDGRVGGKVHIVYPNQVVAGGAITRFEPPGLVAFTYGYADPQKPIPIGGSLVTVTLEEHADGTLLRLHHDLPTEQERDHHAPGWRFQLALFANVVANEHHAELGAMLDRWNLAWAETDQDRRGQLLTTCTTDDVALHDKYACLRGRGDLQDHIRMSQMFMPGIVMTRAGEPRHCQGTALVDWTAADAAGKPCGKGTNVVRLAADGRIASVVGLW
ncbi:MAG TPA: SRPBCC domain-containing protein [Planctomycetota bacterium]|nr:SRPBCC domain-containing protein [Planctomycetota bacterium]